MIPFTDEIDLYLFARSLKSDDVRRSGQIGLISHKGVGRRNQNRIT